jgi:hypothetical protein
MRQHGVIEQPLGAGSWLSGPWVRDHALASQQRTDRISRLRAVAQPVLRAFRIDLHGRRVGQRIVGTDDFDEPAVSRSPAVGRDNSIARSLLRAHPAQAKLDHAWLLPLSFVKKTVSVRFKDVAALHFGGLRTRDDCDGELLEGRINPPMPSVDSAALCHCGERGVNEEGCG